MTEFAAMLLGGRAGVDVRQAALIVMVVTGKHQIRFRQRTHKGRERARIEATLAGSMYRMVHDNNHEAPFGCLYCALEPCIGTRIFVQMTQAVRVQRDEAQRREIYKIGGAERLLWTV